MQKDWLKKVSEQNSQNIAIRDTSNSYTYHELNKQVSLIASNLNSLNFTKPYIPIEVSHTIHFVQTLFACWRIGLTPILLRESIKKNELDEVLRTVECEEWVSSKMQMQFAKDYKAIINKDDIQEIICDNDEAIVIFTSGTTGNNKGVILTFKNFEASYKSIVEFDEYKITDVFLASLPFNHIGGLSVVVRSLFAGALLHIPKSFSHKDLFTCINSYKPNYISLVPTQLKKLLENNMESYPQLKSVYLGGGPSNNDLVYSALNKSFPIVKVYGSTETCAMVAAARLAKKSKLVESSGKLLKGVKVKIDKHSPDKNLGEIIIKSESIFKQYLQDDNKTKLAKRNDEYLTGDIGYVDENNFIYVVGRKDDVIITGGEKVVAAEVQKYIMNLDLITDAYVFGIDDPEWGKKVVAFITSNNHNVKVDAIIAELKNQLAGYKIPKIFLQVENIPKTNFGKYDKEKIRRLFDQMLRQDIN